MVSVDFRLGVGLDLSRSQKPGRTIIEFRFTSHAISRESDHGSQGFSPRQARGFPMIKNSIDCHEKQAGGAALQFRQCRILAVISCCSMATHTNGKRRAVKFSIGVAFPLGLAFSFGVAFPSIVLISLWGPAAACSVSYHRDRVSGPVFDDHHLASKFCPHLHLSLREHLTAQAGSIPRTLPRFYLLGTLQHSCIPTSHSTAREELPRRQVLRLEVRRTGML